MRNFYSSTLPLIAFSLIFSLSSATRAEVVSSTEAGQQTMAKFMESLARYITWPDGSFSGSDAPYKYCLLGDNQISASLTKRLGDKKIKKRSFEIVQLEANSIEDSKSCHLVYIGAKAGEEARPVIEALTGLPILTAGDATNFAGNGGMIGFVGAGRKVALQINKNRLETANLKASSKLFRVSTR